MSKQIAQDILETIKDYHWTKKSTTIEYDSGEPYFMGNYLEATPAKFFGLENARIYIYSPNFDPRTMDETITEHEATILILHTGAPAIFEESDYIWTNGPNQVYVGDNIENPMPEITALYEELWNKPGPLNEIRIRPHHNYSKVTQA